MALSAGTVSISVRSDTTHFGKDLHDGIMGGVSGIGKAVGTGIMAGAAAVIAAGATILTVGIKEAFDASAGTAQLEAGIKSTGNAAGVSADGLNALASSIQGYSGQTDDSIVKSEQLLLTFTNIKNSGTDKIFDQATVASANMAAKMGGDASGSAILLGKALNDPVKGMTALQRVGVAFTQGQKDSIAAMVKHGDVVGAQKIILKELTTEFGGAAEAAGNSLPGMLEKGKRAFEDMSQAVVTTILPIITPAIAGISEAIKKAAPFVVAFAQTFVKDVKEGIERAKPVIDWVHDAIVKVADFITGTAVPAIKTFVEQFANSEGAGGTLRTVLEGVGTFITGTLVPAFIGVGKAVGDVVQFFKDHGEAAKALGVTVGAVALAIGAAWAAQGVVAVINMGKEVVAWFTTAAASTTSATIHSKSTAQIVVGWAIAAAGAVVSAAVIVGGWIATGVSAMASALVIAAAWLISIWPIALVIAAVVGLVIVIVKNWDTIKNATAAVGQWIADKWNTVVSFFEGLPAKFAAFGQTILSGLKTVFGWTPLGLIVNNWDTIIGFFSGLPGRIGSAVSGMWDGIKDSFKGVINTLIGWWNDFHLEVKIPSNAVTDFMHIGGSGFTVDTPNIPYLAQGGIVPATPGGRLVRVGEGGEPEAVIPLPKNGSGAAGVGGQTTHNWYVTGATPEALYMQFKRRENAMAAV